MVGASTNKLVKWPRIKILRERNIYAVEPEGQAAQKSAPNQDLPGQLLHIQPDVQ